MNSEPPEYEARVLTTLPRRWVNCMKQAYIRHIRDVSEAGYSPVSWISIAHY
jgi:hypothetical protein